MTPPRCLLTLAVLLGTLAQPLPADIYRWDTGEVIPGTEGITPGPGVDLDHREFSVCRVERWNWTYSTWDANFRPSRSEANLTEADLTCQSDEAD